MNEASGLLLRRARAADPASLPLLSSSHCKEAQAGGDTPGRHHHYSRGRGLVGVLVRVPPKQTARHILRGGVHVDTACLRNQLGSGEVRQGWKWSAKGSFPSKWPRQPRLGATAGPAHTLTSSLSEAKELGYLYANSHWSVAKVCSWAANPQHLWPVHMGRTLWQPEGRSGGGGPVACTEMVKPSGTSGVSMASYPDPSCSSHP